MTTFSLLLSYLLVVTFIGLSSRGESNIKEAITDMDYSSCNLKEVPDDIKDYTDTLVKLVLESNTITELPLVRAFAV